MTTPITQAARETTMNLTHERLAERVAAADNWVRIAQNESLAERPAHALEAMFGAYKELSALIEPLKTDLPAAVEEIKSLRAQLSAANVEREHALGVSAFARQEADTLRQQLAEANEKLQQANAASGELKQWVMDGREVAFEMVSYAVCDCKHPVCKQCQRQNEAEGFLKATNDFAIVAAMEGSRTK